MNNKRGSGYQYSCFDHLHPSLLNVDFLRKLKESVVTLGCVVILVQLHELNNRGFLD